MRRKIKTHSTGTINCLATVVDITQNPVEDDDGREPDAWKHDQNGMAKKDIGVGWSCKS
jgi:hypothetical protein